MRCTDAQELRISVCQIRPHVSLRSRRVAAAVSIAATIACAPGNDPPAAITERPGSVRVTELVVVDRNGIERIRIGGDLPDALINGKRVPRGERAAGILLYDSTGQERSGYVTWEPSGNVGLTLDTKGGQAAVFVAGRDPGSALMLWRGRDLIELRADPDGARFTAVKNGEVVFQDPEISALTGESCSAYKEARARVTEEQVRRDCRRRFTEGACGACLAQP
jgi:hypothetical protein